MDTALLPIDAQMMSLNDEKLLQLLTHASGTIRARALPTLGVRIAERPHLKEALFQSVADPANQTLVFYAFIKIAWVAAIAVLDHGNAVDFQRLKNVVGQWPEHERQGFLAYVKDHRDFDKVMFGN